ncbi:hypothetical protein CAAN1_05S04060 [[Candida] anglica]|uniref:Uncharacterized protein n=1 Tax=[Candida] anglica TaxID=148631 RepID=A0ABP0EDG9_9ASCO
MITPKKNSGVTCFEFYTQATFFFLLRPIYTNNQLYNDISFSTIIIYQIHIHLSIFKFRSFYSSSLMSCKYNSLFFL